MATVTATSTQLPFQTPTPTSCPTPPPDLIGSMAWVADCAAPILRLTTALSPTSPCNGTGLSTMRLTNANGAGLDFAVPSLETERLPFYAYDCDMGPCMPSSWLS